MKTITLTICGTPSKSGSPQTMDFFPSALTRLTPQDSQGSRKTEEKEMQDSTFESVALMDSSFPM